MRKLIWAWIVMSFSMGAFASVGVNGNMLIVDGQSQPQLYGAEIQYFRLRGGYGRNIPRAQVIALWNKALDRAVEAKMNAVSFYIPWDFHEYAEGKFDFTGTVDEDGDGNPDYPSRDVITFFRLVAEHGIRRIMIRPGPYINAEWGFLGFGAIPSWFHEKYPDSHMMTSWGWRRPLHDYLNPDFLRHTRLWFEALYNQVLKNQMGLGGPILFLQIDNETNYQWQSLYQADYGPRAVARYQDFLRANYDDLNAVNQAQGKKWGRWEDIRPPEAPAVAAENRDWYRFNDITVYNYLGELRKIWENLGVREPQVLFTLAESYNAAGLGLLPNYVYKNKRGVTGLMTVNLYPKTAPGSFLNQPFKSDLDVKSATAAGNAYFGTTGQEWAMGPEIQGGWWHGTDVSDEARQQTYLSVIGHGLKSFFVYYFNEGQNWDSDWAFNHVKPLFEQLKIERHLENTPVSDLDNGFWGELQSRSDRLLVMGFSTRKLMEVGVPPSNTLYFDAPLDENANPRGRFDLLKRIGERVIEPYQDFLARALEVTDDVALMKDSSSHQPSGSIGIDSGLAESDWSGGLLGYLLNANFNPRIVLPDLTSDAHIFSAFVHIDTGVNSPETVDVLQKSAALGQTIVGFLNDSVSRSLGVQAREISYVVGNQQLDFYLDSKGQLTSGNEPDARPLRIQSSGPVYIYDLTDAKNCQGVLFWQGQTAGYRCGNIIQIGALIFADYNSDAYSEISDASTRREFLRALLPKINPQIGISENAEKVTAFARKDPLGEYLWVTVKSGSKIGQTLQLKIDQGLLHKSLHGNGGMFRVRDVMGNQSFVVSEQQLVNAGFEFTLQPIGSTVFVIQAINSIAAATK